MSSPVYDYKVFRAGIFLEAYGGIRFEDSYVSASDKIQALRQALSEGYRLFMIAGEYIILEKVVSG